MSLPICLTEDETAALRQILAMLATIGERGFDNDRHLCEITAETWQDMILRPAARLRRVTTPRLSGADQAETPDA